MQALAELIKRKNEIDMQLLILKNILEYLPDIKQIIIKKIENQTGFDHSHYKDLKSFIKAVDEHYLLKRHNFKVSVIMKLLSQLECIIENTYYVLCIEVHAKQNSHRSFFSSADWKQQKGKLTKKQLKTIKSKAKFHGVQSRLRHETITHEKIGTIVEEWQKIRDEHLPDSNLYSHDQTLVKNTQDKFLHLKRLEMIQQFKILKSYVFMPLEDFVIIVKTRLSMFGVYIIYDIVENLKLKLETAKL